ncbi:MAG: rhodanese-like domain-containing protein [Chloroflexota bacterium]
MLHTARLAAKLMRLAIAIALLVAAGLVATACSLAISPTPTAEPTVAPSTTPSPQPTVPPAAVVPTNPPRATAALPTPTAAGPETLTPREVNELLDGPQKPVVYDTRSRAAYAAGHVPGAVSLPYDEMEARLAEIPRAGAVVLYCTGST